MLSPTTTRGLLGHFLRIADPPAADHRAYIFVLTGDIGRGGRRPQQERMGDAARHRGVGARDEGNDRYDDKNGTNNTMTRRRTGGPLEQGGSTV